MNNIFKNQSWLDDLAERDFAIIDNCLEAEDFLSLKKFFHQKQSSQKFHKAGIGTKNQHQYKTEIRGDFTYWLNQDSDVELSFIFEFLDQLKDILNYNFYLSLASYEFHLAHYPAGSFYKKHLDQFDQRNNRMITFLLYMNEDYQTQDAGQLKIYLNNGKTTLVEPIANRAVIFKSAELYHEVLPTNKGRNSLTGWFLYNRNQLINL